MNQKERIGRTCQILATTAANISQPWCYGEGGPTSLTQRFFLTSCSFDFLSTTELFVERKEGCRCNQSPLPPSIMDRSCLGCLSHTKTNRKKENFFAKTWAYLVHFPAQNTLEKPVSFALRCPVLFIASGTHKYIYLDDNPGIHCHSFGLCRAVCPTNHKCEQITYFWPRGARGVSVVRLWLYLPAF